MTYKYILTEQVKHVMNHKQKFSLKPVLYSTISFSFIWTILYLNKFYFIVGKIMNLCLLNTLKYKTSIVFIWNLSCFVQE